MWILLWICTFPLSSGSGSAAQDTGINNNHSRYQERSPEINKLHAIRRDYTGGSVARVPPCAATCQERYYINTTTECTHHDIFASDVTRCVQRSCPELQDVLDWQTYYASIICHVKPRDIATRDFATAWTLFGFASICAAGRLLARSRWLDGPGFWWDDWGVIILWILEIEMAVCLVYIRANFGGIDAIGPVDASSCYGMLKWIYISVPFYIIGTYGAKIVWVLLYIRMWDFNTAFRKLCWVSIVILSLVTIAFTIGALVVYWPLHYYIDDSPIVRQYHLGINLRASVFAVAAINIAMDFWVLLLPIPKLMSLTGVSIQKKMAICGVFLLGFICTGCSIARLYYIVPLKNTTNITWDFAPFGTWSEIEVHLSMVSCNLPALAGLIKRLRTKYRENRASKSDESAEMTDYRGLSNRLPPKHTPKLNTWKSGSISLTTTEAGQSSVRSADGCGPIGSPRIAETRSPD